MEKCSIKTRFSKYGLGAVLLSFLPQAAGLFPFKEKLGVHSVPRVIVILYALFATITIFTLLFLENSKAKPYERRSTVLNLAHIVLALYYLLYIEIFVFKSAAIALCASIFSNLYIILFSVDRKNYPSIAFSAVFMVIQVLAIVYGYYI